MKDLDEDYPDFLKQLTDHAAKTIDAQQQGKKGKGKNKGKAGWNADRADKGDEQQKEAEQEKGEDQRKEEPQQKGKGKAHRYASPDERYTPENAQGKSAQASYGQGQGKGTQYPYPYPAQSTWKGDANKGKGTWGTWGTGTGGGAFGSNWKPGGNSGW